MYAVTRETVERPGPTIAPDRLSALILHPTNDSRTAPAVLARAYRLWSAVWKETFAELEDRRSLPSDDFMRQDELLTIWHDDECIALVALRWVDLDRPWVREDSYFAAWPQAALDAVRRDGSNICIPSYATIAKAWRHASGCSLKDVLFAITTERFLASQAVAIVGTTRNDRGIDEVCRRNGYQTIEHNVTFHRVNVDLVAFWRSSCARRPAGAAEEAVVHRLLHQLHFGEDR